VLQVVLPLVPLVLIATGATTGAAGGMQALIGTGKIHKARGIAESAKQEYEASLGKAESAAQSTNGRIQELAQEQVTAQLTVLRMAEWLRAHERQVAQGADLLLDGLDVQIQEVAEICSVLPGGLSILQGIASAGLTGAGTAVGVPIAVTSLATASTGVAISGLSGAAAHSATLAWLGGGSLATGGGGMALGATALNFVTVGPALLVGGLLLNGKGEKALTQATAYAAEVAVGVSQHRAFEVLLRAVDQRVTELRAILVDVRARANSALEELAVLDFDVTLHAREFQNAISHVLATKELVNTAVLDAKGALTDDSERVVIKYKEAHA
jgi:hypothetical protein